MISILRYLVILLLLVAALPCIAYASSSNLTSAIAASDTPIATVTSSSDWVVTPVSASVGQISQSISSFFTCVFGVRIFPGADPVGAYSINNNPNYVLNTLPGKISGHMYIGSIGNPLPGMVFYLYDTDNHKGGSYFATTDTNGYYEIDHVPFGNYSVFVCNNEAEMQAGDGTLANSASLTASNPNAVVDWTLTFG